MERDVRGGETDGERDARHARAAGKRGEELGPPDLVSAVTGPLLSRLPRWMLVLALVGMVVGGTLLMGWVSGAFG